MPEAQAVPRRWPLTRFGPDPFLIAPAKFGVIAVTALGLSVLLGLLIRSLGNGALAPDLWVKDWVLASQQQGAHEFAMVIAEITGANDAILAGLIFAGAMLGALWWWRSATLVAASVLLTTVTHQLLKDAIERPRPDWHLVPVKYFSYPSGHSAGTAALVFALCFVIRRVWFWALGAAWLGITIWGRMYLGAHWFSDTVGGMLFALGMVAAVAALLGLLLSRQPKPN